MLWIGLGFLISVIIRLFYTGQWITAIILMLGNLIVFQEIKLHWMSKFRSGIDGIRREIGHHTTSVDEHKFD